MVADIINRGTYRIKDKQIVLTMDDSEDVPQEVIFTISSEKLLVRDYDKTEWVLE